MQPGRITVVLDGTKTMGMALRISAASKAKCQPVLLAVTETVILNKKGTTLFGCRTAAQIWKCRMMANRRAR